MSICQVGTIHPRNTFEWAVPGIRELILQGHRCVRSPDFHSEFTNWYLSLSLESDEWIGIFLHRTDPGEPKAITYTLRLQDRYGVAETTQAELFSNKHATSGDPRFLKRKPVLNRIVIYPSTVTCLIKCDTPLPMQGSISAEKEFVNCAVQTEIASTVIDRENSNDKDWSSLDSEGVAVLSERMKELLIKGHDHDVILCVQGKEFRAHRSILSAPSPVFAMMLTHDTKENSTGTISIEDCDPDIFDEFLLFVYSGRTKNLTPSNALQLYYPADKYDFPVLKERCVNTLKTSLSVPSICDVVLLAAKHQEKELLEVAKEFFAQNLKEIIVTVSWLNFMSQNPVEANELYIKSMEILLLRK